MEIEKEEKKRARLWRGADLQPQVLSVQV